MDHWQPLAAITLVGSMPHKDRRKVIDLIIRTVPEVPVWPQLSPYLPEQMMIQYLEGLPGIRGEQGQMVIETNAPGFQEELYAFYEAYLEVAEGTRNLEDSRFAMGVETGRTFFHFLDALKHSPRTFRALKGQIVGPFTLLTALKDHEDRALIYNEQLQDVVVKHLTMKARWQIRQLRAFCSPVILFLDEPALAGFGSSAFISISAELVQRLLRELVEAAHQEGALAGTHICANTDWDLVFSTGVDVINFDAYNYFDKFVLYRESFLRFIENGHIVAWGMIPTHDPEIILKETPENLTNLWLERIEQLVTPSLSRSRILSQSLFTPSCGCGSLSEATAERVLRFTSELGQAIRAYL
jgi:methionine synthase II (cobalamin-independent)